MIYVGIDPSFSRTGLCHINDVKKEINIGRIEGKIGQKTFQNIFTLARSHTRNLNRFLSRYGSPDYVLSEIPFDGANFSSGLHALDSMYFYNMTLVKSIKEIYNLHPTYLGHVHGTRDYSKSDSVKLGQKILDVFCKNGYTFKMEQKTLCHDEAESVIFATHLFVILSKDIVLVNEIKRLNSKLCSRKEKLLYRRDENGIR